MSNHLLALLEGFGWLFLFIIGIGFVVGTLLFLQWLITTHWVLALIAFVLLLAYSVGRAAHHFRNYT